ncbi:hypothetical protein SAY86_005246 [Trapa natans]|uniref:Uncharacterized protein n=1 Tax=Trapa natans TaxID=22666 RepID=A0AAN7L596_TRANT|nr:hypothetical protein SAY86_005246 [Trapa natans]
MAGNARFASSPANVDDLAFVGTHSNVQRGNLSGASLDRSGSFRESSEGRMFNSSASNFSRGSSPLLGDMPSISQYLVPEPFLVVDQKYPKSGELRKVLGIPSGTSAEDGSSGANHAKLPHLIVGEELKRFKSNIVDASMKARTRAKKFDESLHKLNKYCETLNSKKQQRSELLMNERSGGPNLKMSSQLHRNSTDLLAHRLDDRAKNSSLNMKFRSSLAEPRSDNQGNTRQSLVTGKERDLDRDGSEGSDPLEEKIRRLPAGGEGWEKKMKRKRSMGTVFARPVDSDREVKKATQKIKIDPNLQYSDTQVLRSGSMNGAGGMNKSGSCSLATGLKIRGFSKNEQEKTSVQRDCSPASLKDRALARGNTKLATREEASMHNPTPLIKGKASRAPRSGPTNSPTILPHASEGLESWEQPSNVPKVPLLGVTNNRKRTLPSSLSSSPPMTQWGMQRPQKMARSRRTNVISPMLNSDEIPNSSEGCLSDLGPKMTPMSRGFASGIQQLKVKLENVSSPARLSESEESCARESNDSRLKEKRTGGIEAEERDVVVPAHNVGCSVGQMKKSKMISRDEIGDSVTREGRSERIPTFARAGSSPSMEKLENATCSKLHKSVRSSSDKSGSKSGRPPLKKLSERKAFNRPGKSPGVVSTPDFSGESDDDREELLSAASCASSASYYMCTVNFWKKLEKHFASISSEDISYLEQQIKSLEGFHENLSKKFNNNNLKDTLEHEDNAVRQSPIHGARDDNSQGQYALKESTGPVSLADDDIISICGRLNTGGMKIIPITQRLLAAFIVEDEAVIGGDREGLDSPFRHAGDNLISCLPVNGNLKDSSFDIEYDYHFLSDPQIPDQLSVQRSHCNGFMSKNFSEPNQRYGQLLHTERIFETTKTSYGYDEQYVRIVERGALLELHSIDLFPENVPKLEDGEDDQINKEIADLHKKLIQKIEMKKARVHQLIEAVRKEVQKNGRNLEQIAMEKYIESAHRKQLATRATYASKYGIPKVPKHVAVAFTKRALARFRKFEATGKSCFSESPLIEALSAPPPHWEESMEYPKLDSTSNSKPESKVAEPIAGRVDGHDLHLNHGSFENNGLIAKTGRLPNRGKKKEVLLDDIGGKPSSLRIQPNLGNAFSGGAKGKRSERDRDKVRDLQGQNAKSECQINSKGERKTKAKPKQRTTQLSSSVNGFISSSLDVKKEPDGSIPGNGNISTNIGKENKESVDFANLDLPIESIDDLDVPGWLSFDGDGLQDIDCAGLEIPMDDLSEVFL